MSDVVPVVDATYEENAIKVTWETLTSANAAGAALPSCYMDYSDRSVQVIGTFNGATVAVQGSNDEGTTYATMNDAFGAAATFTAAAIKQITEVCGFLRPSTSGGGGSQDLDVVMICRRPRSPRG